MYDIGGGSAFCVAAICPINLFNLLVRLVVNVVVVLSVQRTKVCTQ